MRLLITNDDGVHAPGLLALRQSLVRTEGVSEVVVVAPDRPRSACGHSITLHKPLRLSRSELADGSPAWVSNGTPSDCVTLALMEVLAAEPPDLVFSGINQGPNLGWDLTYSGTVSAAMEAAIFGVPAVALSLAWRFTRQVEEDEGPPPPLDFGPAAAYASSLAPFLQANRLPPHTLLNINIPPHPPRGVRLTRQGIRRYPGKMDRRIDPFGKPYYWVGGDEPEDVFEPDTDVQAIADHYISVTPVQLDLTCHQLLARFAEHPLPSAPDW